MATVSKLPSNITIDLDAEERSAEEIKPPFTALVGGKEITMIDPNEVDWRDLAMMDNPIQFLNLSLSSEDRQWFTKQDLPGWKFNKLMEAYYQHYDMEELQRKARRQNQLSGV